ncbi:MAG: aminotransferase class V-fold PLP-dependent enzyme [Pirellulales bacterium]|nr:aminotransferase class V-fold PLP-dependent enzyme [Pirellulales bacterium]|tara:strand:- start:1321 stop:2451 length:1131 start_codon:yes stop_codon:yes gene_type:complete
MTNLYEKYNLTPIINACGKMTKLSGAVVLPEIADQVRESLDYFFDLDELQAAAGNIISNATGAESGCVTACTAAGITESIAACMTGTSLGNVLQLPDSTGMPNRVVIQKGHCVNYGAPITQNIRLAGATPVEVGVVNRTLPEEVYHAIDKGDVAAILCVESHHAVHKGMLPLEQMVKIAHEHKLPVILDAAAQDQRLSSLIDIGCDLVITSAHKYLCSTTGGILAGRKELIDAVLLQNRGIGRGMKAGKEAIIGAMAALQFRMSEDVEAWTMEQDRKAGLVVSLLSGIDGLELQIDPDPNGCPFSRARLTLTPAICGVDVFQLTEQMANNTPSIVLRAHHANEGFIYIDAIEMNDDQIELTCNRIRGILTSNQDTV